MSKVATYLQGHISGVSATRKDVLDAYSNTSSVLKSSPSIVVTPRSTNDLRKIIRLSWQLSEKGHPLALAIRGGGTDPTASSISSGGILVDISKNLNQIFEYEPKQRLVRLQPGATIEALQVALKLQGTALQIESKHRGSTVGGAVGFGSLDYSGGSDWVHQLEVILDTGDAIQTGRISKSEFNKRRGQQGREGDIYRGIDTVLEDHAQMLDEIRKSDQKDRSGYPGIVDVRTKNGSFDLTPLLIGSQGTLGVVSEMILQAEFKPSETVYIAAYFNSGENGRDALDVIDKLVPSTLEYFDGKFLVNAIDQSNTFSWIKTDLEAIKKQPGALIVAGFDEFKESKRSKIIAKARKKLSKLDCEITSSIDDEIQAIRQITDYTSMPASQADRAAPEIISGFYVPRARFEDFLAGLDSLSKKLQVELPIYGDVLDEIYNVKATLSLQKVSEKQKLFKLIDALSLLINAHDGTLFARGGEGRLLSHVARSSWSEEYAKMTDEIKAVFDPHGVFNPSVKSSVEVNQLIAQVRSDNSAGINL